MSMSSRLVPILAFVSASAACSPPNTSLPTATPSLATASPQTAPLFEFHSDPWLNLHQRLVAEATWNKYWHATVTPCACAKGADGEIVPAWTAAVAAYKSGLAGRSQVFDSTLASTNLALALAGTSPSLPSSGIDPALAKSIEGAFELYMRAEWPADDARNQAWIAAMQPLVAKWGPEIAAEYAKRFHVAWPSRPIRVEVSRYADSVGGYTTTDPILTTMSSEDPGYAGASGLEMLFHEASHGLDGILTHDLQMAFIAKGKREPSRLDHAIIFYTAGELVRRRIPGYVPYAVREGVYKRGWDKYEVALRAHWQPFLDDRIDFATALDRLATSFD